MSEVTYYLCGFVAVLWIGGGYVLHKLRDLGILLKEQGADIQMMQGKWHQQVVSTIMEMKLEFKSCDEEIGSLTTVSNAQEKRIAKLERATEELDARTAEVKKAKDYIDSGHVFGWDPVASKFAWVKRDEDKDGIPGALHIKTGAFAEPIND